MFGDGPWILKTVGPYSPSKASTNKNKKNNNNTSNSEKRITFIFLDLAPQTPVVVQQNLSRGKMYSVVWQTSLWHVNQKDLYSGETMNYILFRVLATKKFILCKRIDLVVWQLILWHFKVDIEQRYNKDSGYIQYNQ